MSAATCLPPQSFVRLRMFARLKDFRRGWLDTTKRLWRWRSLYGKGPFEVGAAEREHVSLKWIKDPLGRHKKGELIHFGGADTSVHAGYFGRWRWWNRFLPI